MNGASNSSQITAIIFESGATRVIPGMSGADAAVLLSCISDDPCSWSDIALLWERWRFDSESCEFPSSYALQAIDREAATNWIDEAHRWFVVDFEQRRILTHSFEQLFPSRIGTAEDGADDRFSDLARLKDDDFLSDDAVSDDAVSEDAVSEDAGGKDAPQPRCILPRWWELLEGVRPEEIYDARDSLSIPEPRRDVLWGPPLFEYFSKALVNAARTRKDWRSNEPVHTKAGNYELTVQIHRDWLMTARADLENRTPRECLHIDKEWIGRLREFQIARVSVGQDPIPVPLELSTYFTAPFGSDEMLIYFDACRAAIRFGWTWLIKHIDQIHKPEVANQLQTDMAKFTQEWLEQPYEDGPTAAHVILQERSRVPLVNDSQHVLDCDCPICEMMADGSMGPSVMFYDTYALEQDNEFAFSFYEDREEWESMQLYSEDDDDFADADLTDSDASVAVANEGEEQADAIDAKDDSDELDSSVWSSVLRPNEQLPGDESGFLRMAFFVAEMISYLKDGSGRQAEVDLLNAYFRDYRTAQNEQARIAAGNRLKQFLECLAKSNEGLVSRAADLQSRIDEQLREIVSS